MSQKELIFRGKTIPYESRWDSSSYFSIDIGKNELVDEDGDSYFIRIGYDLVNKGFAFQFWYESGWFTPSYNQLTYEDRVILVQFILEYVKENASIIVEPFENGTVIITEDAQGIQYMIKAKYVQNLIDDWEGERKFVPANDAKVYYACYNNRAINPYSYQDFKSLMEKLKKQVRHGFL